jgi:putative aldouronate transport system permease protein
MMKGERHNKLAKTREDIIFDTVNTILLILVIILTLYPFFLVLVFSLNEGTDATRGGIYFFPRRLSLENYNNLLMDAKWMSGLSVSVARTIIGTLLGVSFTSIIAYGMSFKNLMFRKGYYRIIIFAMYFHGGLIPTFVVYRSLGLLNNFAVYVIPSMLNIFLMMVMISFFQDIPASLMEAARMDGASEMAIFVKVVLPLSSAILATAALFIGVAQWNSWLDSAYYIQKKSLRTMSYLMMEIINRSMIDRVSMTGGQDVSVQNLAQSGTAVTTRSLQMAAMIISVVPIICVYPFLQKYFVKGIMLGSIKE